MVISIVVPAIALGCVALCYGVVLGYAAKIFKVEIDERIANILEVLPGINCGACGQPGCAGYAEAIVEKNFEINLCSPGGNVVSSKIAAITGKESIALEKKIAVIHCSSGGYTNTLLKYEYHGINNCKAVTLLNGGHNQCNFGCVFQNDCIKACQFGAISLNENGMRIIDPDKCIGCGSCMRICPRGLIELVPVSKTVIIPCTSQEKGAVAKKNCGNNTACIGCAMCFKKCPFEAIVMKNNIARINYEKCLNCGLCAIHCPPKIIKDKKTRGKAVIDFHKCIGCTICAKKCITNCIKGELKRMHVVDKENCIGCELCVDKCPKNAIMIL